MVKYHKIFVNLHLNLNGYQLIEKHIILEDIDPLIFYGVNNSHLQMIKSLFPKLRIVARDNVMRLLGDEEEMAKAEEDIETIRKHVLKYNSLNDEDILDIIKGKATKADAVKDVVVYSLSGRPIKGRSENQQLLIDSFNKNDMIFAVGPAGTGKTYLGGYTRRGSEYHPGANPHVSHPYGMEYQDDYHRRHDPDRPAPRAEERTEGSSAAAQRYRRHLGGRVQQEGHRAPQAGDTHRQCLRSLRQGATRRKGIGIQGLNSINNESSNENRFQV